MVGKGDTAEVLEYGADKVCKLFFEGYPKEYVELEYQNAKEMYKLKLNVPQPFEIVIMGNRSGIIYERIYGRTLLSLMSENRESRNAMLDEFVRLHCEMLDHHSKSVLSYKEFLTAMVKNKLTGNQGLIDEINTLPDGDSILHGDFHPGNILIKSDGTPVIIDFMNVCYGPALYDIARTFFLLKQSNAFIAKNYLEKIGVLEKDIIEYIRIIEKCRQYEA